MGSSIFSSIEEASVLAVVSIPTVDAAVPLAEALLEGGVKGMELTLRTPAALEGLARVCSEVPEMLVGAGTVLTPQQVEAVREAGASFAVAPGTNPRVIAAAREIDLPFAPGICTPTDIEMALEEDCQVMKFFPSEPTGGLSYLRNIAAPFTHLGVKFIPLGGVNPGNAEAYLSESMILAIGGSWLAPPQAIAEQDWTGIRRRAEEASAFSRAK
ncbi:MAG: bifunctional 4-hydroxy-2-oxoglutarate aldolase/2-dehydro-3-deoxy-phosphogluconate aldolase [Verrucomicrobiota bacterium]